MNSEKVFFRSMHKMGNRAPIYLLAILGMSVSYAMFSVMGSLLMKNIVDMAAASGQNNLLKTVIIIVLAGLIFLLIYACCTIIYNVEAKRIFGVLSEEVLDEEIHLPFSYYENHHSGEIISKVAYDLNGMGAIYGSRFRRVVMPMLQVIVLLIPMLMYCWQLALCMVFINCVIVFTDMVTLPRIGQVKKKLSEINKIMTQHLSDMIQGMSTIRMFSAGHAKIDKIKHSNRKYYKSNKAYIRITAVLDSITNGCDLLCGLLFVLLGLFFVNKGITTFGAVAAIYTMYGSFSKQFLMIGKYIPELSGCLANAENIFEFLDTKREPENWYDSGNDDKCGDSNHAVEVKNVTFSYNKEQNVLDNLSLDINVNECVAITGASGCGKTTLSKLMLGLYPVDDGDIRLLEKSIKNQSLSETRANIAYVPQDAYLFNGTVMENIRYGNAQAGDEEVYEAAKLANAHEFIEKLENGYNEMVNDGGVNFSGGQRQRLAIARAVVSEAPIIILDEATSALDPDSERKVNQALRNIKGRKTIIMIAHRPSTIEMADRVINIEPKYK